MAPRTAQKNRTRVALLEAARRLMDAGEEVTVARVADLADISRATAYRYFSDPAAISIEAVLDLNVAPAEEILADLDDPRARVQAIASYYLRFTRENEAQLRQFLAQTMRQWLDGSRDELRGARRIRAFSAALEPVKSRMKKAEFDDLVLRLSMLTGLEQHIVFSDILGVDEATADRLQAGLIDAALDKYLPG